MFAQLAVVAALAATSFAAPQGVTSAIAPTATAPANCKPTYTGSFNIEVVNATTASSKRSLEKRADSLTVTLANGVLTDNQGRTGYIAANYQFQFDKPAQTGAIYTAGWSACTNGSLALGGSNIFYQCLSGDFYNLYDRSWAAQCSPILIQIVPVASSTNAGGVTQTSDGQIGASTAASASKSSMVGSVVTQITDGQIQATTVLSAAKSSTPVVSQITDGQIQATTAVSAAKTTTAVVSQITDGQIQATTPASAVKSSTVVVSQITDGQIQATTPAQQKPSTTTAVAMFTGAANMRSYANEAVILAAGAVAAAFL